MTSISQPVLPLQAPSNASQVAPAHSSSSSASGRAPPQAAGTASATAKTSYASATKKTFSPPAGSGTSTPSAPAVQIPVQHGKPETSSPVNGRVAIPPAVPTVGASAVLNGNTPTSSSSGVGEHSRKPSVTISAAGASGYMPNGGPVAGKPIGDKKIQFGSHGADSSLGAQKVLPPPNQSTNTLAVNTPSNPRVTSPQTSPSPIPQPPASGGGRPPSSLHGNSTSLSFGNFGGPETNQMRPPGAPQGPLAPGPQSSHLRRESSQSQHSDMSNHAMPPGGRGGYPSQAGRGRGNFQGQYPQQNMGYIPGSNSRPPPSQPRNSQTIPPYQNQNRSLAPFPNSPHQAARSPALANSQLAHPQPGQVPMQSPQLGGQQSYGYPNQYSGYPHGMGPPQGQYGYDPSYVAAYYGVYGMPQQPIGPGSPRPPNQMTPGPQQPQYHPGQYNSQQQPSPMSRTSSAISHSDRPSSSMGRPQGSSTPALNNAAAANRHTNSPAPKPTNNFQIPPKKKGAGVVIKNPNSGDIVTFEKSSASPAPPSKSPAGVPTPTPSPRTPSHTDVQQPRTENKSVKTDDEKRKEMRETIAKKMEADKAEEERKRNEEDSKAAQEKKDGEDRLLKEKEEADAMQRNAAAAQLEAEEALKKDKAEAEEAKIAAAKAKAEADEAAKAAEEARKKQEQEDEDARLEAEFAEMERKEQEAEERYAAKKKAEKEEAARKEAEAFKMADEEMKRAEREAEEAEEARLKEIEKSEGNESQKERVDMFAQLKKDGSAGPASDLPAAAEETPVDSGVATPASDAPAPTASSKTTATGGKQKPSALKIDTAKPVEPAQPSAQLLSLRSARRLMSINDVSYPAPINSPNPALNTGAPTGKLRYNKEFLLQFQRAFVEKPSENWTERVKETVGDTSEPSSARTPARGGGGAGSMMTGRQPSNRAPLPQMGAFAQGGRTLPPNTTSSQRFEASTPNRNAQPARPTMQNPLANFVSRGPGGGFPTPATSTKMDRTPSTTSINHPNSPRNASQRGGSQRGSRAATRREDPKDNKAMPLTAGVNLKPIEVTSSGWKPRSVGGNATGMAGPAPGGDGHLAPDVVQGKVKSNLNKMTPNNFEKITAQILDISSQSKNESDGRTLRQVIQLTFEKATDEAHWAEMYAQFCKRMLESMSPEIKDANILDKKGEVVHGGALFRKYLLNRCQEEFERGWKLDLGDKPEGETEEAKMLSDEYYKEAAAKRRGLGLVRFIGELYKLGMLTERIMHECVKKLVDYEGMPDEAEVESLTNLLKTIGQSLDSTEKGPRVMDVYFMKINEMIVLEGLPSRLRFMLMDIVDLRKKNWQSKGHAITGPTTLVEVRAQAVQAEREKEMQRQQDSSRRGGAGGGRPPVGRGDARNFSGGGQYGMQPPPDHHKNTVGMDDLRRLGSKGGSRQVSSQGQPTLGPTSMFGPRGSNTRRPGMAGAQKDDSGASSRTGTPPAQKEKREKEEKEAAKSANTFSALAGLESSEATDPASPPSTSPQSNNAQPVERQRAKSPKDQESAEGGKDAGTN